MSKILVIDDERPTLKMFRLILGAYGHSVLTAENGEEGLQIFEKEKPPIVLTDVKMPGLDGLEVLKRLKKVNPLTEVIIITGHGDTDLAVKALDFDATDFINKPIHKEALDAALRRAEQRLKWKEACEQEQVSLREEEGIIVMDIRGNVTALSEGLLSDSFEKASSKGISRILIHFNENCSINRSGIDTLIQLLTKSRKRNQLVGITGLPDNLKKIFEIIGITQFAGIFNDEEDAIRNLAQEAMNP